MAAKRKKSRKARLWWIYIVRCSDGTFYTGMTKDVARRLHEHNHSPKGARYTRLHRPVSLVYREGPVDQRSAMRREIAIKRLPRPKKAALLTEPLNQESDCQLS